MILYELLTGSTSIPRDSLRRAGLEAMLRVIREVEPPTPSSRISTSDALPSLAAARHIEPSRLSRFLKGDLDWIVMKAMAKERHRRYDSAIGLANDIERFTNHEPVLAGPPTAGYRLRKFARRNRGQVVAASLVLLALVGGIVGTSLGLVEARRQEREATRQERLAKAEAGEKEKARQAEADQRRQAERRLGQIEKINEHRAGSDSPQYAKTLTLLGPNLLLQEMWTDAESTLRDALAIREAKEPDAWTTFNTKSMLGGALLGQKKFNDAEPLLKAGYEGMRLRAEKIPVVAKIRPGEAVDRLIGLAEATNRPDDLKRWKEERAKWPAPPTPKSDAAKK